MCKMQWREQFWGGRESGSRVAFISYKSWIMLGGGSTELQKGGLEKYE